MIEFDAETEFSHKIIIIALYHDSSTSSTFFFSLSLHFHSFSFMRHFYVIENDRLHIVDSAEEWIRQKKWKSK